MSDPKGIEKDRHGAGLAGFTGVMAQAISR